MSSFKQLFAQTFEEFESSSHSLNQDWLILYYTPEIDESLDARAVIQEIEAEYESRII